MARNRLASRVVLAARCLAAAHAAAHVATAARRRPPLRAAPRVETPTISVIVPARNEEARIGPLLDALVRCHGVSEVIVVDDVSSDGTAELAARAGVHVVRGVEPPPGWRGKPWALQQGLDAAHGEWIVALDADTRPSPSLPVALVAEAIDVGLDLVSASGRFECPTPALRFLHPALLTTLLYRFPAPGSLAGRAPRRLLANGQCMAFRRDRVMAAGGFESVRDHLVEDVALTRRLAAAGWSVGMVDAAELLTVRMYETAREAALGWGRSLSMPGVDPLARRLADTLMVASAQALPLVRVLARRADALDGALLAMRLGTLAGTARAYQRRTAAYWLSPMADAVAVAVVASGLVRRRPTWRGRRY